MSNSNSSSFGKILFTVVIVIIAVIYFLDEIDLTEPSFTDTDGTDTEEINIYVPDAELNIPQMYYEQLNREEKRIYNEIKSNVSTGKVEMTITGLDQNGLKDKMLRVVEAFEHDHPEYFWINGGWQYSGNLNDNGSFDIDFELTCFEYWNHSFNQQKYLDKLNYRVNLVTELAKGQKTDYDKVKFVHDYLVQNAEYDYDALAESEKTIHDASSEYIYSAYGCLVNKKTVCAGYAKAFQLILNNLGIDCTYITGDAGGPHAWNMVTLEDENYYFDVTWNDSLPTDKRGDCLYPKDSKYDYFGLKTNELEKDHTVDRQYFDIPECTENKYNYFVYNGYFLDSYDIDKIKDIINSQPDKKVISVRFSSYGEFKKAYGNISKICKAASSRSFSSYSSNEELWIITLYEK